MVLCWILVLSGLEAYPHDSTVTNSPGWFDQVACFGCPAYLVQGRGVFGPNDPLPVYLLAAVNIVPLHLAVESRTDLGLKVVNSRRLFVWIFAQWFLLGVLSCLSYLGRRPANE